MDSQGVEMTLSIERKHFCFIVGLFLCLLSSGAVADSDSPFKISREIDFRSLASHEAKQLFECHAGNGAACEKAGMNSWTAVIG